MPDSDLSVPRRYSTMARSSTMLNRPQNAPMGPRTSKSLKSKSSNVSSGSNWSSPSASPPPPSTSAPNLYLPEFGGLPHTVPEAEESALTPITEGEVSRPSPASFAPSSLPAESATDVPTAAATASVSETRDAVPLDQDDDTVETPRGAEDAGIEHMYGDVSTAPATNEALSEYVDHHQLQDVSPEDVPQHDLIPNPATPPPEEPSSTLQTPSSITLSLPSVISSTPSRTPSASSTIRTIAAPPPKLAPPPPLKWDSEPVQWKGLTLDAALWTFDSKELQSIVSRAIRSSALESFIRLLTLESLDKSLPEELKRLESAKTMTQAKYRFLVHRRTMQLQALLSSTSSPSSLRDDDGHFPGTKLTVQLSETVAECDQVMGELLKITDQIAQVQKLIDHHWASALAIALRKLNGSFGRRSADLKAARERIAQLEAALDEAWNEAERLAREMDDIDGAHLGPGGESDSEGSEVEEDTDMMDEDETAIIETAEKLSMAVARTTSPSPGPERTVVPLSLAMANTHPKPVLGLNVPNKQVNGSTGGSSALVAPNDNLDRLPEGPPTLMQLSALSPLVTPALPASPSSLSPAAASAKTPKTPASGTRSRGNRTPTMLAGDGQSDAVSIKSAKSTKSTKSMHHRDPSNVTRTASVSAARTRSYRASQSSLRLPAGVARKARSGSTTPYDGPNNGNFDSDDHLPPVPTLPIHFAPTAPFGLGMQIMNAPSANASSTLLHDTSQDLGTPSAAHFRRSSLDSARGTYGHRTPQPWQTAYPPSVLGASMDDMYVGAGSRRGSFLPVHDASFLFQQQPQQQQQQQQLQPNYASGYGGGGLGNALWTAAGASGSLGRSFTSRESELGHGALQQARTPSPPPVPPKHGVIVPMEQYGNGAGEGASAKLAPRRGVSVKERLNPLRASSSAGPLIGGGSSSSKQPSSIPSIWMNADAPAAKTPAAERVDSLMRGNSKGKAAYQRLRTLTKRYSLPFPMFSKANASGNGGSSPGGQSVGSGSGVSTAGAGGSEASPSSPEVEVRPWTQRSVT